MIEVAELYKKVTGHKFFNDFCFNYPEKERPPIRLLKSETGLAANIVNVEYWVSQELGTWQYIEVQNDTAHAGAQADVKETRNKNLERQKNASSEIVMNADKARTNQNKK